jgi:hypothetical protein
MLFRQLGHRHLPSGDLEGFAAVLGRLEDLYENRNLMAHGQWITRVPQNTAAVMSFREKLPEDTPRNEIMATEITMTSLKKTLRNMVIIANYLVDLRKRVTALRSESAQG